MIDKNDFAFGVQAQNSGIDFVDQEFTTVLLARFLLIAQGRRLVGDCFKAAIKTAATAKANEVLGKNRPKTFPLIGLPASASERLIRRQF